MNYSKEVLNQLDSVYCESADNYSNSSSPLIEQSPIFQALKGYVLFKHHAKLKAIVQFLCLSSYNPIIISRDQSILAKLESLCKRPKLLLSKRMKGGAANYPSVWTAHFCAKFICEVVELIEEDRKVSSSKTVARKSPWKKGNAASLPPSSSCLSENSQ